MSNPRRDLSPERKAAHYVGLALTVVGFLLFVSPMCAMRSGPSSSEFFADPTGTMDRQRQRSDASFGTALVGFGMVAVGGLLMGIGRNGLAGSGIVPDPQGAREDLEPWNRAAGGMLNDALEEATVLRPAAGGAPAGAPQVKVRCPKCRALNDETARFCDQCGAPL